MKSTRDFQMRELNNEELGLVSGGVGVAVDLSDLSGLLGSALGVVTGLVGTAVSTVTGLVGSVGGLLSGVTGLLGGLLGGL